MKFIPKTTYATTVKVISKDVTPYFGITSLALSQMKLYIDGCADEIGWFFTVSQDTENKRIYYVKNCHLFPQQVHATTTEIDNDKLTDFATKLLSEENGMEIWNELRGWGHSHVNMGITPSGQDDSQMEFFSRAGQPFFVRIIANKKADIKIDLYDYENGVAFIDVPWLEIPSDCDRDVVKQIKELQARLDKSREEKEKFLKEEIEKEIKAKVSKFAPYVHPSYLPTRNALGAEANFTKATTMTRDTISTNRVVANSNIKLEKENDVFEDFTVDELKEIGYQPTIHAMREMVFILSGKAYSQNELILITTVAMDLVEKDFYPKEAKRKQNKSKLR